MSPLWLVDLGFVLVLAAPGRERGFVERVSWACNALPVSNHVTWGVNDTPRQVRPQALGLRRFCVLSFGKWTRLAKADARAQHVSLPPGAAALPLTDKPPEA